MTTKVEKFIGGMFPQEIATIKNKVTTFRAGKFKFYVSDFEGETEIKIVNTETRKEEIKTLESKNDQFRRLIGLSLILITQQGQEE